MSPIDDLAQAMNQRQVTDDEGKPMEENDTPQEAEPALEEKNAVEDVSQVEKPAESDGTDTQTEPEEDEIDYVPTIELEADETGKRYVPESRFKEVYGKMKDFERKLRNPEPKLEGATPEPKLESKPIDKTDAVEIELLRATLPQFNAESENYSRELDELGFAIYKATPGITRLEAARKAISMAKQIQSKVAKVEQEARTVKAQQSDQGITNRVTSRLETSDVPNEDASPDEIEKWLKAKGQW